MNEGQAIDEVEKEEAGVAPVKANPEKSEVVVRFSRKRLLWSILAVVVLLLLGAAWKFHWYQAVKDRYNAASVTLKVREGDTFPIEGAAVSLAGKTYVTDHNGKLTLNTLAAGEYPVVVKKDGYLDSTSTLHLHRGDNDLQFIALTKAPAKVYSVSGFVQDYVSNQPITDVQVTLGSKTLQTDPSGKYHFEGVAPAKLQLTFSKAGYKDKQLEQDLVDTDLVTASVPLIPTGHIVFVSNRDGKRALYVSDYDGSNQRPLVTPVAEGEDFAPVLSPTHKNLAFSTTRGKVKTATGQDLVQLYVVGQDGQNPQKVSDEVAPAITPLWSNDGQFLYYTAYTSAALSQSTHKVYSLAKHSLIDIGEDTSNVTFSPDSTLVAYTVVSSEDQPVPAGAPAGTAPTKVNYNVVKTLNLLNGERKTLVKKQQYVSDLRFSDDGKAVSYEVAVDSVRHRYQVALDTPNTETEVPLLTFSKRVYASSPDGNQKAFIEERDGKTDLFLVDKNGNNEKRLTTLGVANDQVAPLWDDSGQYLTFAVKREAENAYYIVSVNGGEAKKITDYYVDQSGL